MQFDEDDERGGFSGSLMIILVLVGLLLIGILGMVLLANQKENTHLTTASTSQLPADQVIEADEKEHISSGLRAEDLDFWDMYPEETQQTIDTTEFAGSAGENAETQIESETEDNLQAEQEEDPATDGKHTSVVLEDGSTTYLVINNSWPRNSYEDTQFQKENNRLKYYVNNKSTSTTGIDLSKCTGKIKFDQIKEDGISFVMLHMGGRGYDTGVVSLDDQFKELADAATGAGMNFGVVFSSQAITGEEALEEVQFIQENIASYPMKFPIVVEMLSASNDIARTERLTVEERTDILKTELAGLQELGFPVLLAGDKRFLLTEVDLSKLTTVNVWYKESGELPDYPYQFAMWQYDKGYIAGVEEQVPISICFIDYAAR